jgi:hypothetical protein
MARWRFTATRGLTTRRNSFYALDLQHLNGARVSINPKLDAMKPEFPRESRKSAAVCRPPLRFPCLNLPAIYVKNPTQRRQDLARQSRNQKNFTEANEGNEEQEKFCQKCAILGNSTATAQRTRTLCAFGLAPFC